MKKIQSFILCLAVCMVFFCTQERGTASEGKKVLRVGILNGPTSIPAAYLYENPPDLGGVETSFDLFASPLAELPKLLKNELDIGFLPANAAAKVYVKNNGSLIALGISGNGNLSLLTTNPDSNSFSGLRGKTVSVAGQGATPEYIFRYLLAQQKLKVGDGPDAVGIDFSIPASELAAALLSGKIQYALLPEPFATVALMKSSQVHQVVDIQAAYSSFQGQGSSYPLTLLVCTASYLKDNPEIVAQFIEEYKKATAWTVSDPVQAGALVQKYTLGLMAPVAARSIPKGAYVWIDATAGRSSIEKLFDIYLTFAPEAIGGSLPDTGFYYKK
jgi:NitT/TauT family transport system substrate-binding protein